MTVALVGPTASGKSEIAVAVARAARSAGDTVELVSVDSMAVYRGMDIGTAKPSAAVRAEVPYHLVDLVDPDEEFTVTRFQAVANAALEGITSRGRALLVGGTGLYLRAVTDGLTFPGRFPEVESELTGDLDALGPPGSSERLAGCAALHVRLVGLDPIAASRIEPGNERRLVRAIEVILGSGRPFSSFGQGLERYPPTRVALVGVDWTVEESDRRIAERFVRLMDRGFLDEVRALAARPAGLSRTARQALGYRELLAHVETGVPVAEAVADAVRRTRAFARRQRAWFRRDPRIEWIDPQDDPVDVVRKGLEVDPPGAAGGDPRRAGGDSGPVPDTTWVGG